MRTFGATCGAALFFVVRGALATPFTVYDDALSSSFSDKSVAVTPNYAFTTNPYAGSDCVGVQLFQNGQMIVASTGTPDISQYGGVDFYHRTSAGSLTLVVGLRSSTQVVGNTVSVSVSSTWTNAHLTLADFGLNQNSGKIVAIQFGTSTINVPGVALDQITLFDATLQDGGISDASTDASVLDAGSIDASSSDASSSDASTSDASSTDASSTDASSSDGSTSDASSSDAASSDASKPDSSTPFDASQGGEPSDTEPNDTNGGCSCDLAAPAGYGSAIPLALVALALIGRRRRS